MNQELKEAPETREKSRTNSQDSKTWGRADGATDIK